jgi:hypothetical protein
MSKSELRRHLDSLDADQRSRILPDLKEFIAEHSPPAEPDWASMSDHELHRRAASFSEKVK